MNKLEKLLINFSMYASDEKMIKHKQTESLLFSSIVWVFLCDGMPESHQNEEHDVMVSAIVGAKLLSL